MDFAPTLFSLYLLFWLNTVMFAYSSYYLFYVVTGRNIWMSLVIEPLMKSPEIKEFVINIVKDSIESKELNSSLSYQCPNIGWKLTTSKAQNTDQFLERYKVYRWLKENTYYKMDHTHDEPSLEAIQEHVLSQ